MVYFTLYGYNKVVKFDPSNATNPPTEIGDDLGARLGKRGGGVLGNDGNMHAIPYIEIESSKLM